jgi:hypothetical protein
VDRAWVELNVSTIMTTWALTLIISAIAAATPQILNFNDFIQNLQTILYLVVDPSKNCAN